MSFEMATTIVMMKAAVVHHFVVGSQPTAIFSRFRVLFHRASIGVIRV
jgi:hypothetical protein